MNLLEKLEEIRERFGIKLEIKRVGKTLFLIEHGPTELMRTENIHMISAYLDDLIIVEAVLHEDK